MSFILYLAASLIAIAMTKSDVGNSGKYTFLIVAILSASEVISWNLWGRKK